MGEAFQQAIQALRDTGQPDFVQEVIAKRIIEIARRGTVVSSKELCSETLKSLGFNFDCD
jgi:hypothetical protein